MHRAHHRKFHSLFARLAFVILTAIVVIGIVTVSFFHFYLGKGRGQYFMKTVDLFVEYVVSDIGYPPDLEKAKKISQRTLMNIYIEGFTPGAAPINPDTASGAYSAHHYGNSTVIFIKRKPYIITQHNGIRYIFYPQTLSLSDNMDLGVSLFLLSVVAVVLLAYLFIRRMLRPFVHFRERFMRISRGDFSERVPVRGPQEFAHLALGFNRMSTDLAAMLRLKEQLLYDVSHELRSPLARMNVAIELADDPAVRAGIKDDIALMNEMIEGILTLGKNSGVVDARSMSTFTLVDLAKETARSLDGSGSIVVDGADVQITADKRKIQTVIKNLLENALKYTGEKKEISVSVCSDDEFVFLSVRDNGVGISAADLPHVFEPFYRADRSRSRETGGFGLGLSIAKRIVEGHGGTISAESSQSGSVINIRLPL